MPNTIPERRPLAAEDTVQDRRAVNRLDDAQPRDDKQRLVTFNSAA